MPTTTRITRTIGLVAGLALGASALAMPFTAAQAAEPGGSSKPATCSQQQRQVERAEKALEKVTAVFAKQEAKADPKHGEVAMKTKAVKARKAQVQRLAKAEARLEACQDAQDDAISS